MLLYLATGMFTDILLASLIIVLHEYPVEPPASVITVSIHLVMLPINPLMYSDGLIATLFLVSREGPHLF